MAKTMKKCEKTVEVMANFDLVKKFETLVSNGIDKDTALKTVNTEVETLAIEKVVTSNCVNFDQLINKVYYEQLRSDLTPCFRLLKANNLFILKANKKSNKIKLSDESITLLTVFGANLLDNKLDTLDESILKIKRYARAKAEFDCFTCETCTSKNKLEEQLQVIFDTMCEGIKAKKSYVTHLQECYIKANEYGYKNGNEIVLLQLAIEHAFDCKYSVKYNIDSKLTIHKSPKESK